MHHCFLKVDWRKPVVSDTGGCWKEELQDACYFYRTLHGIRTDMLATGNVHGVSSPSSGVCIFETVTLRIFDIVASVLPPRVPARFI